MPLKEINDVKMFGFLIPISIHDLGRTKGKLINTNNVFMLSTYVFNSINLKVFNYLIFLLHIVLCWFTLYVHLL